MREDVYHHGDLRHTLVEAGIKLISEEGVEKLSLRKVAKSCGVSNAAPYAHFKSKEAFIDEISLYIENQFVMTLEETKVKFEGTDEVLTRLGEAYVSFFVKNPYYYYFLFSRRDIEMDFSLNVTKKSANRPLEIFKKISLDVLSKSGASKEMIQNKFIAMWALVHGLANIATMPNSTAGIDWKLKVGEIIQSISVPYYDK